ncbi:YceI family protein [Streptomyces sp. NPDC085932]|uniref:YceI family protein n=1 Tax=Streptomyces sp. NPDC085932 TaxID=3365741 RepID=UPI0037D333B8
MTAGLVEIPGYVAGTWVIDRVHSEVGFMVRHLMISKVRGQFTSFEGEVITDPDPLKSRVTATIDLGSISTGNEQRDAHVRSGDFLGVDEHPTMTYRSTAIRTAGADFILDGELTLKGITRVVPLKLEINGFGPDPFAPDPLKGARVGFTATGEINRMDFNVNFNGPVPGGGVVVSESVQIFLEIEAALRSSAEIPDGN